MRIARPLRTLLHRLCAAAAALLVASGAAAQAPPPPAAGEAQNVAGVVRLYLLNEFGDVEGVIAQDGAQVRFPPHMGADLVRILKPGDRFVAEGDGAAGRSVRAWSLGRPDGERLTEARPSPRAAPPLPREARAASLKPMQAEGPIAVVLTTPRGDPDGVVLADDTIVRWPPRSAVGDASTLRVGARLAVRGDGTRSAYGTALRAESIGVDGREPTTQQPRGPVAPPPAGPPIR